MKKYHYTECGLDNIYLVNGFEIKTLENGEETIFIHDINGLHKVIGKMLVFKRGLLIGKEVKFIRTTLDLSQTALGNLLGLDYQTILSWEKDKASISRTADRFLKIIFFSYLNPDEDDTIYEKINEIAALDAEIVEKSKRKIEFKEIADEWKLVA